MLFPGVPWEAWGIVLIIDFCFCFISRFDFNPFELVFFSYFPTILTCNENQLREPLGARWVRVIVGIQLELTKHLHAEMAAIAHPRRASGAPVAGIVVRVAFGCRVSWLSFFFCGFVALLVAAEEGPQAPPSGLQEFLGHPLMVPQRGNIN